MITKATVTTTAAIYSPARNRSWVIFQNVSDTAITVSFEGTTPTIAADVSPGLIIAAGATLGPLMAQLPTSRPPFDANIWAMHEGVGSKTLVIHEG